MRKHVFFLYLLNCNDTVKISEVCIKKILIALITFLVVPLCTHASVPYMLGIDEQTKMEWD